MTHQVARRRDSRPFPAFAPGGPPPMFDGLNHVGEAPFLLFSSQVYRPRFLGHRVEAYAACLAA